MRYYNIPTVFVLWLFTGWLGLHHFYLRRDRHAFVWFWTCGGFLFGWLFELFRIPDYVESANADLDRAAVVVQWAFVRLPPFRMKRVAGELVFSIYLSCLVVYALPDEIADDLKLTSIISSFAIAIGVHTVANIGKEECSFKGCMFGAFIHIPFFFLGTVDSLLSSTVWSSFCSTFWATYRGRRVRVKAPPNRSLCRRLVVLSVCNIGMVLLLFLAFYYHADVKVSDGGRLRARILIDRYFASVYWQQKKLRLWRLLNVLYDEGLEQFIREFSIVVLPRGEQSAYKVLGLRWNANDEEIRERYLELAKTFHPDKFSQSSAEERKQAELQFVEIQQSYEKLRGKRGRSHRRKERTEL